MSRRQLWPPVSCEGSKWLTQRLNQSTAAQSEQLPSLPPPLHPSRPFPLPLAPFPSERGCVQEVSIRVAPLLKVFRDTGDVTQTRPANELAIRWSVGRKVTLASLLTSVCLSGRIRVRLQSPEVPGSKHLSPSILDLFLVQCLLAPPPFPLSFSGSGAGGGGWLLGGGKEEAKGRNGQNLLCLVVR